MYCSLNVFLLSQTKSVEVEFILKVPFFGYIRIIWMNWLISVDYIIWHQLDSFPGLCEHKNLLYSNQIWNTFMRGPSFVGDSENLRNNGAKAVNFFRQTTREMLHSLIITSIGGLFKPEYCPIPHSVWQCHCCPTSEMLQSFQPLHLHRLQLGFEIFDYPSPKPLCNTSGKND